MTTLVKVDLLTDAGDIPVELLGLSLEDDWITFAPTPVPERVTVRGARAVTTDGRTLTWPLTPEAMGRYPGTYTLSIHVRELA